MELHLEFAIFPGASSLSQRLEEEKSVFRPTSLKKTSKSNRTIQQLYKKHKHGHTIKQKARGCSATVRRFIAGRKNNEQTRSNHAE
jgi:hypothetical protein